MFKITGVDNPSLSLSIKGIRLAIPFLALINFLLLLIQQPWRERLLLINVTLLVLLCLIDVFAAIARRGWPSADGTLYRGTGIAASVLVLTVYTAILCRAVILTDPPAARPNADSGPLSAGARNELQAAVESLKQADQAREAAGEIDARERLAARIGSAILDGAARATEPDPARSVPEAAPPVRPSAPDTGRPHGPPPAIRI